MYEDTLKKAKLREIKSKNKIKEKKSKEKPRSMFDEKPSKKNLAINNAYDELVKTKVDLLKKAQERNVPKKQIDDLRKDYERVLKRQKLK